MNSDTIPENASRDLHFVNNKSQDNQNQRSLLVPNLSSPRWLIKSNIHSPCRNPSQMAYRPRPVKHNIPLPPPDLSIPPPAYRLPALISTYSHLPDRSIRHDDTSMAYYSPAPIGADLNYGFENRIERDESVEEHLDGLCEALKRVEEQGGKAQRAGGVITWRGMITR